MVRPSVRRRAHSPHCGQDRTQVVYEKKTAHDDLGKVGYSGRYGDR